MTLDELLRQPAFGVPQAQKQHFLLEHLNSLTEHHREHSEAYRRIVDHIYPSAAPARRYADLPYLPVVLFKSRELVSVPPREVQLVMTSSGTTGQQVSRIYLDRETARRQTIALSRIMQEVLGPQRLPMLIVDSRDKIMDRQTLSARGVGILGMMNFGRNHLFALSGDPSNELERLTHFLAQFGGAPFLIFGFTFIVWEYFLNVVGGRGLDLSRGILIHSGGWKKLQEQAVSNPVFKARLKQLCGLERIYNFYGMVEQVGSVFLEGEDGYLHPPVFSDVLIRDPQTWEEVPDGSEGLIQVVSALPYSYPGHSILTEDLGVVRAVDNSSSGRLGKAFEVLGRLQQAELRGCSDTHAFGSAA